jgi:hypothetical protein
LLGLNAIPIVWKRGGIYQSASRVGNAVELVCGAGLGGAKLSVTTFAKKLSSIFINKLALEKQNSSSPQSYN